MNLIWNKIFFKKMETDDCVDNVMYEKNIFKKLIAMDDFSGLADRSNEFANFLTVARKFSFTCVYVFYTIYPYRFNWQIIILQTKIFNIFSGPLQTTSVANILSSYCNRYTYDYIPHRDLWINSLYFKISDSNEKKCLTIDTRDINNLGLAKIRTGAENGKEQICYYNCNRKDKLFNRFLAVRKETSADEIIFSIVNLIGKTNNLENVYYKIDDELKEFGNDRVQLKQSIRGSSPENTEPTTTEQQQTGDGKTQQRRVSKKPRFLSR